MNVSLWSIIAGPNKHTRNGRSTYLFTFKEIGWLLVWLIDYFRGQSNVLLSQSMTWGQIQV